MIIDKFVLDVLGYFQIKKLLEKEIYTAFGKQYLQKMSPISDMSLVLEWQKETSEMKNILEVEGDPPFVPLNAIEEEIRLAEIQGSVLDTEELLAVARVFTCLYFIKEFFSKIPVKTYTLIPNIASRIKTFRILEKEIRSCINEEAEVVDEASPNLKKIRHSIRNIERKIRERLESIIKDPKNLSVIQDGIITIRQGRYVIPIKLQEKSKFPGVIQDKSESGQTIFIEPLSIVEFNNELRELYQEEKKEKYRILQKLTTFVGQKGQDVINSYRELGNLDFIHAKAKISIQMKAAEPKINMEGIIRLYRARNPLLKNVAVPIDIELGNRFDVLVITGPNTGGKTVTLKTVGLFNLMVQSGLHIPADMNSEVAVFEKIFADIGDEQSIEQNLSTFSSHMQRMIKVLNLADHHTLVLLDELGAGTDPSEGSALGMAILDSLKSKGAKIISTTHHDSLKAYAYLKERVMNARVEFNELTLRPTYKVSIGLPGKSCAFLVALRLGLSEEVIRNAQEYLEKEKLDLENLIKKMEKDRDLIAKNLEHVEKEKNEIVELRQELARNISAFESEKQKVKLEAYREANTILSSAEKVAREMINSLKRKKYEKEDLKKEKALLEDVKKEIKRNIDQYECVNKEDVRIMKGNHVLIKSLGKEGIVLEKNQKKKQCQIQVENLRLIISFSDIERIENDLVTLERKQAQPIPLSGYSNAGEQIYKKAHFKNEINIRQMNAEEAQAKLEKYLDDAFLLNVSPVYIIHGKGKGILRQKTAELLSQLHYVKSYRYGESYEGGDGVTVVYF